MPDKVAEQLHRLAELAQAPLSDALKQELCKSLASKVNHIVAKAADITRTKALRDLLPDLASAFGRFMLTPERTDKGCTAKIAIVKALHELDHDDPAIFLTGLRHIQLEPAFGGPVDTAIPLREASAIALARLPHRSVLLDILPLLVDPAHTVRSAAAQAIAATGREEGQLLLRLKILTGDEQPDVIAECLSSLLQLTRQRSLDFVAAFLDSADEALREGAALALGASRLPEAFNLLRQRCTGVVDPRRLEILLTAIAMLRDDSAQDYLLSLITEGPRRLASAALNALKLSKSDDRLRAKVQAALASRDDPTLRQLLDKEWRS